MLVDNGDLLSTRKFYPDLYADLILGAYNQMGYDAINIGAAEVTLGLELIRKMNAVADFPMVSANLVSEKAVWRAEAVKVVRGLKIAIVGALSHAFVNGRPPVDISSPQAAIADHIRRLRPRVDIVILLAQMPYEATVDLVGSVTGIDIAIVGHQEEPIEGQIVGDTFLISPGDKGERVSLIDLSWDTRTRNIVKRSGTNRLLDETIPDDPAVIELVKAFNSGVDQRRIEEYQAKQHETMQSIDALTDKTMKMTPDEFFKYYNSTLKPKKSNQP